MAPQRSLSSLSWILSSTDLKASGPTRMSPRKGRSSEAMVKSIRPIVRARAATISVCTVVLRRPKRYVNPTTITPSTNSTAHRRAGSLLGFEQTIPSGVPEVAHRLHLLVVERPADFARGVERHYGASKLVEQS